MNWRHDQIIQVRCSSTQPAGRAELWQQHASGPGFRNLLHHRPPPGRCRSCRKHRGAPAGQIAAPGGFRAPPGRPRPAAAASRSSRRAAWWRGSACCLRLSSALSACTGRTCGTCGGRQGVSAHACCLNDAWECASRVGWPLLSTWHRKSLASCLAGKRRAAAPCPAATPTSPTPYSLGAPLWAFPCAWAFPYHSCPPLLPPLPGWLAAPPGQRTACSGRHHQQQRLHGQLARRLLPPKGGSSGYVCASCASCPLFVPGVARQHCTQRRGGRALGGAHRRTGWQTGGQGAAG